MEIKKESEASREPYEAPAIEDVPLRPEEQVLAGCKTFSGGVGPSASVGHCGSCVHPGVS